MINDFGFISGNLEIKMLILYALRKLHRPVSFDVLAELTMCEEGISYFEFADCAADLEKTGHLLRQNEQFSITNKGIKNSKITEENIPFTVRKKADERAAALRARVDRDSMIKASHSSSQASGCTVSLSLSDGIGEIISINMIAPNEAQAEAIEKGFRKNAEVIYNRLVEMILE